MKTVEIGGRQVSEIVLGTMRIAQMSGDEVAALLGVGLDCGIDFIDTADIYGNGRCEELLGAAFTQNKGLREKVFLQSKCGIRLGADFNWFDFSEEYILGAVDTSLQRLQTDHLDTLLLHRPDALMEPDEIAKAFTKLEKSGKVLQFGVSNMNPGMIELLKKEVRQPIVVDQLQFSCAFTPALNAGFHVNMEDDAAIMRDGGIFEYCRLHGLVIQAWSSLQYGYFAGSFIGNSSFQKLNAVLERIAQERNATPAAVALAWILRYPGAVQAVIGTTSTKHMEEAAAASEIELTRHEWYEIYLSAGNALP